MRRISIDYAEPGMVVARNVFNSDGKVLLAAGMTLKQSYIKRIKNLGIQTIYIKDKNIGDLEIPDVISEETRVATIKTVKSVFTEIQSAKKVDIEPIQAIVNNILDELLQNKNILIHLTDVRCYDDYTFGHSVNVCLLSLLTGMSLGYSHQQLHWLGIGALLHDLGKTLIDWDVINKTSKLTSEEYEEVKKHAEYGFDILRQIPGIPLLSAHVAYQHHEKYDGSGYPRRLAGKEIQEFARITAVADVYDALLADRPYRLGYSNHKALEILTSSIESSFDPAVMAAFVENIAVFPIGSIVQLSTGEIGVVVDVHRGQQAKPIIRLLFSSTGEKIETYREIDLGKLTSIYISRIFSEELANLLLNY
jgi:HD-GYP domain-containing protein (c-di-GMP phosphodiesterase class II)